MRQLRRVHFDRRFLLASRRWLRDPDLRRSVRAPEFTDEEQERWFSGLRGRDDYLIWGVEFDGRPAGAFGLKNVEGDSGEYWGYIGEPDLRGMGIGTWMLTTALDAARQMGLSRVTLRVGTDNEPALRLYEKMGFTVVGAEGELLLMERHLG